MWAFLVQYSSPGDVPLDGYFMRKLTSICNTTAPLLLHALLLHNASEKDCTKIATSKAVRIIAPKHAACYSATVVLQPSAKAWASPSTGVEGRPA